MTGASGEGPPNQDEPNQDDLDQEKARDPQDGAADRLDESASQVRALRADLESGELRLDPLSLIHISEPTRPY